MVETRSNLTTQLLLICFVVLLYACKHPAHTVPLITANNWEKIGPGGGGATFIPSFSFASPDDFFVRCDMTGAYQTADGGQSFRQINHDNGANCFAWDPLDSNTVYIGSAVLSKSADKGKTWTQPVPFALRNKSNRFYR